MLPGPVPGEAFWASPSGCSPCGRQAGWSLSPTWPGRSWIAGYPRKTWTKWLGRGRSGLLYIGSKPCHQTPCKQWKMDGWRSLLYGLNRLLVKWCRLLKWLLFSVHNQSHLSARAERPGLSQYTSNESRHVLRQLCLLGDNWQSEEVNAEINA